MEENTKHSMPPHPVERHKAVRPKLAIIDNNILAMVGLKTILQNVMPIADIETFCTFNELEAANPNQFMHYFVAIKFVLENRNFFLNYKQKTIVLTTSTNPNAQLSDFKSLCINTSEELLVKSLLQLEQYGHAGGKNLPDMPRALKAKLLSDREIEVLSLIAQGYINKEIGNQLNIGLTTVISHRKNIVEKLGMKSVSALTIYAVMHGYVDINKI
jgi:transcriptional regulator, luxR family protein